MAFNPVSRSSLKLIRKPIPRVVCCMPLQTHLFQLCIIYITASKGKPTCKWSNSGTFVVCYAALCSQCCINWGRVTHICVRNLITIGTDDGLLPGRRQAIIWTNARILLTGPLGKQFRDILIKIDIFSFERIHLKPFSAKGWPYCLGFNVLTPFCNLSKQNYMKCISTFFAKGWYPVA